jgi:carboxyl-terminal processing protease
MIKRQTLIITLVILIPGVLLVGLIGGFLMDRALLVSTDQITNVPSGAAQQFDLMAEAWQIIQKNYVDRPALQPTNMAYGAISGMVDSLGDTDHSRFLSPEALQQERNFTQGQFEGIGAEVMEKDGHVVVVAPLDGSPAQQAGVKPGYIFINVDGKDVTGLSLQEVVNMVLGPAGSSVQITFQDPQTGDLHDVTITRARIQLQNVTWTMIPGTQLAHIRLAAFSSGVTQDLQKAISEAKAQGAQGIVLDLRNDPGGLLNEAVGVASQFLAEGNVLQEKNAQGTIKNVPVTGNPSAPDIPLVVLINQGTASAAEIVSGALQDAQRAKLVGETTFGTGTVLDNFPLSDGSNLLLATQEWLTPKGSVIWHHGITPDETVALPPEASLLVPESERQMSASDVQASQDTQLLEAIKLLSPATTSYEFSPQGKMVSLFAFAGYAQ